MEYLNCAISALENQHFVIYIFKLRKIIQVLMFQTFDWCALVVRALMSKPRYIWNNSDVPLMLPVKSSQNSGHWEVKI